MVDFKLQLHCISIYQVSNCEFWTSTETILGYNVQNIDATRKQAFTKTSY